MQNLKSPRIKNKVVDRFIELNVLITGTSQELDNKKKDLF